MSVRDVIQAAAGASGSVEKTFVEDVFQTYLYTGNGSTQTINNGIDLAGKGGMVWIKGRSTGSFSVNHVLQDTANGANYYLSSNQTNALTNLSGINWSFNSSGFSMNNSFSGWNNTDWTYASWTFRKAPKFFDVVTYTGDGSANRVLSHSLGQAPGMIFVKKTSASGDDWAVYHRSLANDSGDPTYALGLLLNSTYQAATFKLFSNSTYQTDTTFRLGSTQNIEVINASGAQYVAYLFAHDTSSTGLIQCGSFTTDASGNVPNINLGWEPQYLLTKSSSATGNWNVVDTMRGWTNDGSYGLAKYLQPNLSNAEANTAWVTPTATGFTSPDTLVASTTYIYMAIRRGPMRTPTDGTKVYQTGIQFNTKPAFTSNFPVDMAFRKYMNISDGWNAVTRLQGSATLGTESTAAETTGVTSFVFDSQNGWATSTSLDFSIRSWMFRRAPGFFDVVCYTGDNTLVSRPHNLAVAPELIIIKQRNANNDWFVGSNFTATNYVRTVLNVIDAGSTLSYVGGLNAQPTSTGFTVYNSALTNASGSTYVAYLFATCPGVSKVGSYTGNGTSQTINCGFTNGARFVLIKRTNSTGDWYVWDTARGIVASNDPHLSLNTEAAQVTTDDTIDPDSTGFIVNQVAATNVNVSGGSYIYLAIA